MSHSSIGWSAWSYASAACLLKLGAAESATPCQLPAAHLLVLLRWDHLRVLWGGGRDGRTAGKECETKGWAGKCARPGLTGSGYDKARRSAPGGMVQVGHNREPQPSAACPTPHGSCLTTSGSPPACLIGSARQSSWPTGAGRACCLDAAAPTRWHDARPLEDVARAGRPMLLQRLERIILAFKLASACVGTLTKGTETGKQRNGLC